MTARMTMRMLLRFISWIPAYYRLFRKWYFYPENIDFALTNYEKALYELTGGRLSKILYSATYIVGCVQEHFCDDCDMKEKEK